MYLGRSDAAASLQLSSQRKRDLLAHFETNVDELDRWRAFNAAYHEDDYKFMQFLVPPGKRVLELGCGRGDLLAALEPSHGVGVDFGARDDREGQRAAPRASFRAGRRRGSADAGRDRGSVRLHRDRRYHRHVRGHRRHVAADPQAVRAVDADHHLLLLPSLGADAEARRDAGPAQQAAQDQLHRDRRLPAI